MGVSAFAEHLSAGPEQERKTHIYKSVDLDLEVFIGLTVSSSIRSIDYTFGVREKKMARTGFR